MLARQPLYGARDSECPTSIAEILVFATELLQTAGILSTAKAGEREERWRPQKSCYPESSKALSVLCPGSLCFQSSHVAMICGPGKLVFWLYSPCTTLYPGLWYKASEPLSQVRSKGFRLCVALRMSFLHKLRPVQQWKDPFSSSLAAEELGHPGSRAEHSHKPVAHGDPSGPGSVQRAAGALGTASFDSSRTRRIL